MDKDISLNISDKATEIKVACPKCDAQNTVVASDYIPNTNAVFIDGFHYGLHCSECKREIIIQTNFQNSESNKHFDPIQHLTSTNDVAKRSTEIANGEAEFINNIDELSKNNP